MKKAMPSIANGRPITSPNVDIRPGHSRPISKLRIVPDTAPTANSTAEAFAHRLARPRRVVVVVPDPAPVEHVDHRREGDAEARQDDVEAEREGHLVARGGELLGGQEAEVRAGGHRVPSRGGRVWGCRT